MKLFVGSHRVVHLLERSAAAHIQHDSTVRITSMASTVHDTGALHPSNALESRDNKCLPLIIHTESFGKTSKAFTLSTYCLLFINAETHDVAADAICNNRHDDHLCDSTKQSNSFQSTTPTLQLSFAIKYATHHHPSSLIHTKTPCIDQQTCSD